MRLFLALSIFIYSTESIAQNCKPNINVTVYGCGSKLAKASPCPACNDCLASLRASDSSFTIVSYIIRADGAGFDEGVEEAFNTGAALNEAKKILFKVRPGSYVEFTCIKAKDKNGIIYILQPLTIQL